MSKEEILELFGESGELLGPLKFWQQKLWIYKYFPNNPFSKKAGRFLYHYEPGKKKERYIHLTDLRSNDENN